jgi:hypothetical protein
MRVLFGKAALPFEPPKEISLILFVKNLEEIFTEIQQRGLAIVSALKTYGYGMKEFSILDCNGYLLRFSESV